MELRRVIAPVRQINTAHKGDQPLQPVPRVRVADDRLLVVRVERPHELAAEAQPTFLGTRHICADHVRAAEIAEGLLVVRSHHPLQQAGVVGLLVPGHDENADAVGRLSLQQLAQVGVGAPGGRLPSHQAEKWQVGKKILYIFKEGEVDARNVVFLQHCL
jgi:hypothetical protein